MEKNKAKLVGKIKFMTRPKFVDRWDSKGTRFSNCHFELEDVNGIVYKRCSLSDNEESRLSTALKNIHDGDMVCIEIKINARDNNGDPELWHNVLTWKHIKKVEEMTEENETRFKDVCHKLRYKYLRLLEW